MAIVLPFKAIRYDSNRVEPGRIVAPPYDVISPSEQDELYSLDPHNIIRIILNRAQPDDPSPNAVYLRASHALQTWLSSGILIRDERPSFYIYEQEFTVPTTGTRHSRTSLLCALGLEPYEKGVVLPHEQTRTRAKDDRLRLMRSTESNPEPIYALYQDEAGELAAMLDRAGHELVFCASAAGDEHRLFRLDEEAALGLTEAFRDKKIWIADGHHRYETALAYQAERRAEAENQPTAPWNSLLVALSSFTDPGLVVMPTHRLVKGKSDETLKNLLLAFEDNFVVEDLAHDSIQPALSGYKAGVHRMAVLGLGNPKLLTLRTPRAMRLAKPNASNAWRSLDVAVLQTLILDQLLGIPESDLASTSDIGYTRSLSEAIGGVKSGEWQLAFCMADPSPDEILGVAAAGEKMPPKSTFFYPKLWSGIVLRSVSSDSSTAP